MATPHPSTDLRPMAEEMLATLTAVNAAVTAGTHTAPSAFRRRLEGAQTALEALLYGSPLDFDA